MGCSTYSLLSPSKCKSSIWKWKWKSKRTHKKHFCRLQNKPAFCDLLFFGSQVMWLAWKINKLARMGRDGEWISYSKVQGRVVCLSAICSDLGFLPVKCPLFHRPVATSMFTSSKAECNHSCCHWFTNSAYSCGVPQTSVDIFRWRDFLICGVYLGTYSLACGVCEQTERFWKLHALKMAYVIW